MKLLPVIAALTRAEDCFVCKATVPGNPLIDDSIRPEAFNENTDHECFAPSSTSLDKYDGLLGRPSVKKSCTACFALAYSLEYLGQNGTTYEYTMHRGCQDDYPSLTLPSHLPAYASKKPTEAWKAVALNNANYGTYGTINARYMTHPADTAKAGYATDKTEMAWNVDYGLKCYHENVLRINEDFQNPTISKKSTCASTDAKSCYSLVANYEGDENGRDVRYTYAKRGCSSGIETVPTVGINPSTSVFFDGVIPGTTVNSTMELNYCGNDGCNNYNPTWKSSALSLSATALLAIFLF